MLCRSVENIGEIFSTRGEEEEDEGEEEEVSGIERDIHDIHILRVERGVTSLLLAGGRR